MLVEKSQWYRRIPFFLIGAILLTPLAALATSPTQITPDAGVVPSNYQFALIGNSPTTYVKFDSNFYADGIAIGSQQINFTNIAIGASGATQSFGLNVQSANLTITGIASDNIGMRLTGSATTYFYYALSGFTPSEVDVSPSTGNTAIIKSASMYTTLSDYNAASSPAVYLNTAGQYLQIKSTDTGSTSIVVYQTSAPTTTSGGGGGGGPTPTYTPTIYITQPAGSTTVSGTITISATVNDVSAVSKVELYIDGSLGATATSWPYEFSLDTTKLANGYHTIMAKAYDSTTSFADSVSVAVSNTISQPKLPLQNIIPQTGSLAITVQPLTIPVTPGVTTTQNMLIKVSGSSNIIISSITFNQHPEWFHVQTPASATLPTGGGTISIPITILVSMDAAIQPTTVTATVTATDSANTVTQTGTITLQPSTSPATTIGALSTGDNTFMFIAIGAVVLIGVGVATAKKRR